MTILTYSVSMSLNGTLVIKNNQDEKNFFSHVYALQAHLGSDGTPTLCRNFPANIRWSWLSRIKSVTFGHETDSHQHN